MLGNIMIKTGVKVGDAMTMDPITISPSATIREAAQLMKKEDVGSLLVLEKGKLIGIVTEEDFTEKVLAEGLNPEKTKISEVMIKELITITPEVDLYDALLEMNDNKIRQLPVMNKNKMVGYITLKDILKIYPQLFELVAERYRIISEEEP